MRNILLFLLLLTQILNSQVKNEVDLLNEKMYSYVKLISKYQDSINQIKEKLSNIHQREKFSSSGYTGFKIFARKGAKIKTIPHPVSYVVKVLDSKSEVKVIDYKDDYFLVWYEGLKGWVNEIFIYETLKSKEFVKFKNQLLIDSLRRATVNQLDKVERENIRVYGYEIYNKLRKGEYWIGMTKKMAKISLGDPETVNRSVGAWGVSEQWVYKGGVYLYFENDKLTSYQN